MASSAGLTLLTLLTLALSRASRELAHKSIVSDYTGYGLADAWAGFIWNRFPAEAYPLFLSPLIKAGRVQEAQERSRVEHLTHDDIDSYSGYITVHKRYRSNMFFWFFPAETNRSTAPVLLWLNGGPGRTSLVGALLENGPLEVTPDGKLKRREVSWTKHFSMLYVDNPVGVGYSFTMDDAGLSRSMPDVALNLYSMLVQFFQMFPQYSENDFYVGGQSYAGKYVPSLGCYIHNRNTDVHPPEVIINLKGIYLGAGYCDPEHMMPVFADFLFSAGFVSDISRQRLRRKYIQLIKDSLSGKEIKETIQYLFEFFTEPIVNIGIDSADNLLGGKATNSHLMEPLERFMRSPAARLKLHVGFAQTSERMTWSKDAANSLKAELLTNTSRQNAFLMDNYKVIHYSGNLDIVVNVPMTEAFLEHVEWSGQQEYRLSQRRQWWVNGLLAGWFVTIGNFTRVIVRNSGHMVPYDQPERALDMMKRFIFDEPFGPNAFTKSILTMSGNVLLVREETSTPQHESNSP